MITEVQRRVVNRKRQPKMAPIICVCGKEFIPYTRANKHCSWRCWHDSRDHKSRRDKKRFDALALLGDICVRCGFSDPRALQFDHVAGDGWKDRKNSAYRGVRAVFDVLKNPGKYQILCANCNFIKCRENNEVPKHNDIRRRKCISKCMEGVEGRSGISSMG